MAVIASHPVPRRGGARRPVSLAVMLALVGLVALALTLPSAGLAQLSAEQQQSLEAALEARTAEVEKAADASAEQTQPPADTSTAEPTAAPAGTGAPLDAVTLGDILRDPQAREALRTLLDSTGGDQGAATTSSQGEPPAADATAATPAPGPGIGAGTGMAGLARAAVASATSGGGGGEDAGSAESDPQGGEAADGTGGGSSAAPALPSAGLSAVTSLFHDLYEDLVWTSDLSTQVPQVLDWLALQGSEAVRGQWLTLTWQIGLVVLVGLLPALLVRLFTSRAARRLRDRAGEAGPSRRAVLLSARLLLTLVPIAVFAGAAQATLPLIDAPLRTELVAAVVITALVLVRGMVLILRGLLSPRDAEARLIRIGDDTAHLLARGLRRVFMTVLLGYLVVEVARLLGMPPGGRASIVTGIGLITLVLTLHGLFTLRGVGRRAIRRMITSGGLTSAWIAGLLRGLSDIWHVLASAYAVGIFFAWSVDNEDWFAIVGWATVKTIVICLTLVMLFRWIQHARDQSMMRLHGAARFDRAARQRARRYLGFVGNIARALAAVVALLLVLESWHVPAIAWLTEGSGNRLASMVFNILLVLGVSVALWEGVNHFIQRYLSTTDKDGNVIERGQRERTLLPLLRNVLTVILVVVVSLMLLSELGVDIAPLLAGAGVVGLAVGFGSQKLVQDVISGVFNLLEDTIAVGDVVQVGSFAGVVEAMSIRSLRLRDLSGNLHTIPFSNVDTVTNMTKDFSYYLMNVGVSYRENTDEVVAVLKEISAELREDAEYGPSILEPIEVLGVDGFQDSAVIIKARLKTKPIMQWWVGREFNRRMKFRFDALGIEIPFPHTTVYFGVDKNGNAPPAHLHVDRLASMGARKGARTGGGEGDDAPPSGQAVTMDLPPPDEEDAASRGSLPDPDGGGPGEGGR
jgi:small conductance mechanosensitive channel